MANGLAVHIEGIWRVLTTNSETNMEFDPHAAIEAAKEEIGLRKARHYKPRTSKLEPYRKEIASMHLSGSTLEQIAVYLEITHHLSVHESTILRYLQSINCSR